MQPTPTLAAVDIERIVRREFPDRAAEVLAVLAEYGVETWHREVHRVQAAVLKLAGGNLQRLRAELEAAKSDYRDVLAYAEYPSYFRNVPGPGALAPDEEKRIVEDDWKQYGEWLRR